MKAKKFANKFRFASIAMAFMMLLAPLSAIIGNRSVSAEMEEAQPQKLIMPNYDTQEITKTNLKRPKVTTFGDHEASYYPSYINQLSEFNDTKKSEILAENQKIIADTKEAFANGTLKDTLKKHVSADGQFSAGGNFDKAARIEKVITINNKSTPRKRSLGMFAPAGEIITVTIDESLVNAGLTVNIGYPYSASDIGSGNLDRWPNDRMAQFYLEFTLKDTVTYIGSPLGGMITLNGVNTALGNFKITLSGGVDMPDYKLGASTQKDWNDILAAPAPYVWLLTPYQYFVMPKAYISDIADPYKALLWWHNASMISIYGMARETTAHFLTPVISIYDNYVFTGEAVATVWAFYTNSPSYWCHGILDYDNLMYSGAWGAIHEYNHHHQSHAYSDSEWGVGGIGEITNNVLNAASYILMTDIATTRSESNIFSGWAAVSDPYCNYNRLADVSASTADYEKFETSKLFGFVDIMHTFGADKFLDYLRAQYGYGTVEGYDGTNLTQDGYLNTQDGFALFTSLYFKTDFVDYFTKVWHFSLSSEIISKIKSHGFDEYFSITNLYSSGIKGIETGRAYKINIGTTNVLKFNDYTLCSTDDYKLESVSQPKHGKLTDNGDGTYNYVPESGFTEDSLELVYKVTLNGKTYTRTLVVKLTANYQYIETVTYNADPSKRSLSVQEAIDEFENDNNVLSTGTANSFSSSTPNGDNLTRFKATVVFPFSKTITLMVYGDDKALLKIGGNTAYTTTYIGNDNAAKEQDNNKITLSVKAGEPIQIEAYCFNAGGAGNLRIRYSEDGGETYQDIPGSYCYSYNASKKEIDTVQNTEARIYPAFVDFRNLYLNLFYSDSVRYIPTEVKCLDNNGNEVKTVVGADINAMFDDNTSTGFHTAWRGEMTAFPHNYYFTFEDPAYFNEIKFMFQAGYYAIGEYEIYTSDDGENYQLLKEGNNTTQTNFNVQFDETVSAKYVKLVVKSNSSGQPFTNITEIQFCQSIDMGTDYNIYSSGEDVFGYNKKWKSISGTSVNNCLRYTKSGKVKFYLTGTDLMLFSTNAQSKITIDGVTYNIKENQSEYAPSFIIDGLSNERHLVEIDANEMSLNMIKTTGSITSAGGYGSSDVLAIIIILAIVLIIVGGVTTCVILIIKRRRSYDYD